MAPISLLVCSGLDTTNLNAPFTLPDYTRRIKSYMELLVGVNLRYVPRPWDRYLCPIFALLKAKLAVYFEVHFGVCYGVCFGVRFEVCLELCFECEVLLF